MRDGSEPDFDLTYPQSFDFYTDIDYLNLVSEAIRNGLPPFLVQANIMKYMKSLFSSDIDTVAVYDLIMDVDRLVAMDDNEIIVKKAQGIVADWEVILHDSALTFVKELLKENPQFLEQDYDTKRDALIDMAKEKASEASPDVTETIVAASEPPGGSITDEEQ